MRGLVSLIIVASALIVSAAYSQESDQFKKPDGIDYVEQPQSIGPITPTDTLWRIAVKVRPDNSVTIYQVMQALYNQNPNSFLEQNLNHIKNGAYLKIPTLAQIKRINNQLARQRAEQDEKSWTAKQSTAVTQAAANLEQAHPLQVANNDSDSESGKALAALANSNKLLKLQQQFKQSVNDLEQILVENDNLKQQLTSVSNELNQVRQQLDQDSEIQQQLKELIVRQSEIIVQQSVKQEAGGDFVNVLSNPRVFIFLITIAALLIIFVVLLVRKRAHKKAQSQRQDYFIPQAPHNAANVLLHHDLEVNNLAPKNSLASGLSNQATYVNEREPHQANVFFTPPDLNKEAAAPGNKGIDFALPVPQSHGDIINEDDSRFVDEAAAPLAVKPIDHSAENNSTGAHDTTECTVNAGVADDNNTAIDTTLANSLEELTEAQAELKREDVAAITAAFNQQQDTEYQHELTEGKPSTPESSAHLEDNDEDDNDEYLKSVDELLNELQQASVDEISQQPHDETNKTAEAGLTTGEVEQASDEPSLPSADELLAPDEQAAKEFIPQADEAQNIAMDKPAESEHSDQAIDDFLIELDDIQVNKQLNQELSQQQTRRVHDAVTPAATPQPSSDIAAVDNSEFNADFDSLAEQSSTRAKPQLSQTTQEDRAIVEPINTAKFVEIDSLFAQADATELEYEPYNDVNIDVGLSEFDAFLASDNLTDVDAESGGYAAKLDLARAYIEIDDAGAALKMIDEIINQGPEEVQAEALSLKAKLK